MSPPFVRSVVHSETSSPFRSATLKFDMGFVIDNSMRQQQKVLVNANVEVTLCMFTLLFTVGPAEVTVGTCLTDPCSHTPVLAFLAAMP